MHPSYVLYCAGLLRAAANVLNKTCYQAVGSLFEAPAAQAVRAILLHDNCQVYDDSYTCRP